VYDVGGRLVKPLASQYLLPGSHSFRWDASRAASGVYLIRLETRDVKAVEKVMVVK
jgi:hypothetical protein